MANIVPTSGMPVLIVGRYCHKCRQKQDFEVINKLSTAGFCRWGRSSEATARERRIPVVKQSR